jgi:hypothetical protein
MYIKFSILIYFIVIKSFQKYNFNGYLMFLTLLYYNLLNLLNYSTKFKYFLYIVN